MKNVLFTLLTLLLLEGCASSSFDEIAVRSCPTYEDSPKYEGSFIFPLERSDFFHDLHGRNAVDLEAPLGTSVFAVAPGVVITARMVTGFGWKPFGNLVVLEHEGGIKTVYAHLETIDVSVGKEVSEGEIIGTVGSTGNSTGPHLHFEICGVKNPLVRTRRIDSLHKFIFGEIPFPIGPLLH